MNESTALQTTDTPSDVKEVAKLLVRSIVDELKEVTQYPVGSAEDLQQAATDLLEIKTKLKEVDDLRKSITRPMDEQKARAMAFFEPAVTVLNNVKGVIEGSMLSFKREQDRLVEEERRRAKAEADQKAKEERDRIAEENRKKQEEIDRQAAEEREARQAEAMSNPAREDELKVQQVEADRKAAEAKAAADADAAKKAADVQSIPVLTPEVVRPIKGMVTVEKWKWEIIDITKVPEQFKKLVPDEEKLDAAAAKRGAVSVEGVRFFKEETIRSRK